MRWSISMQRELPGQWVVEAAYVGNRSYDLTHRLQPQSRCRGSTSRRARCATTTTINFLTANVTNPFAGLLPGDGAEQRHDAAPAAAAAVSAVPATSTRRRYDGSSSVRLGAVPAREALQRRLHGAHELHLVALHGAGDQAERHRHRLRGARTSDTPTCRTAWCSTASGSCRSAAAGSFGSDANRLVNAFIGDWSVSAIWNWQTRPSEPVRSATSTTTATSPS